MMDNNPISVHFFNTPIHPHHTVPLRSVNPLLNQSLRGMINIRVNGLHSHRCLMLGDKSQKILRRIVQRHQTVGQLATSICRQHFKRNPSLKGLRLWRLWSRVGPCGSMGYRDPGLGQLWAACGTSRCLLCSCGCVMTNWQTFCRRLISDGVAWVKTRPGRWGLQHWNMV